MKAVRWSLVLATTAVAIAIAGVTSHASAPSESDFAAQTGIECPTGVVTEDQFEIAKSSITVPEEALLATSAITDRIPEQSRTILPASTDPITDGIAPATGKAAEDAQAVGDTAFVVWTDGRPWARLTVSPVPGGFGVTSFLACYDGEVRS